MVGHCALDPARGRAACHRHHNSSLLDSGLPQAHKGGAGREWREPESRLLYHARSADCWVPLTSKPGPCGASKAQHGASRAPAAYQQLLQPTRRRPVLANTRRQVVTLQLPAPLLQHIELHCVSLSLTCVPQAESGLMRLVIQFNAPDVLVSDVIPGALLAYITSVTKLDSSWLQVRAVCMCACV